MRYELFEEVSSIGSKDIREQRKGESANRGWMEAFVSSTLVGTTLSASCPRDN